MTELTATVANITRGPMNVVFGGTNLGQTRGGVEINFNEEINLSTADKFGGGGQKAWTAGMAPTITATFVEITAANLALMSEHVTNTAGTLNGGGTVGSEITTAVLALTHINDSALKGWTFHKCVARITSSLSYQHGEDASVTVEFTALIDDTKDDGKKYFEAVNVSDETAPQVSSSVPADGAVDYANDATSITVTFDEAVYMPGGGIDFRPSVSLANVTDDAAVTISAAAVNSARTVMTITHAAIGASKDCVLSVGGLSDQFGNVMTPELIFFSTAS